MEIKLYSAEWCKYCKNVIKVLEDNNLNYEYVDMDTEEGQDEAVRLQLRTIPFAIIDDEIYPSSDQIINKIKTSL